MKILLTGGTGFVGSSIREELSKSIALLQFHEERVWIYLMEL